MAKRIGGSSYHYDKWFFFANTAWVGSIFSTGKIDIEISKGEDNLTEHLTSKFLTYPLLGKVVFFEWLDYFNTYCWCQGEMSYFLQLYQVMMTLLKNRWKKSWYEALGMVVMTGVSLCILRNFDAQHLCTQYCQVCALLSFQVPPFFWDELHHLLLLFVKSNHICTKRRTVRPVSVDIRPINCLAR